MKIENAWTWTVYLFVALCNRVSVHGFIHTGSERGRGVFRLAYVTTPPLHGGARDIHRPLQVSKSNDENGVSKQEAHQRQHVSKNSAAQKSKRKKRFAVGDELNRLRADLDALRENLYWAEAMEDGERTADLKSAIMLGEQRDPDLCYKQALLMLAQTKARTTTTSTTTSSSKSPSGTSASTNNSNLSLDEKQRLLEKWQKEAEAARSSLPQFQLEGLWVGNYGDQGNEIINVTYVGDTLLATKATGDVNVPRGEISFSANFSPRNGTPTLEPLKLSFGTSSSASSTAKLPRFAGKGQIAKPGFIDHKYVDGQLILFERGHFSFIWLQSPTKHHVLFRRPTPEQTIELLRDIISKEDELENMREHVARCFDMDRTESLARQHAQDEETEPFRRIALKQDLKGLEQEKPPTLEPRTKTSFNFWQVGKWRQYIDGILRDDGGNREEEFW